MESGDPELAMTRPATRLPLFALTVAVHLALGWALFATSLFAPVMPGGPVERMTWVDLPASTSRPREPLPAAEPRPSRPTVARAAPASKRQARRAAPFAPPASNEPDSAAPPQPASAAPAAPAFDREAALAAARKHANDPDPARAGTALAQFDARRELRETEQERLGRQIAGAKRGDCIGPNAGGNLLTPLFWLLDKKDGGCKF